MNAYKTLEPLANNQPAPELDTDFYAKRGERERIENENAFRQSRTFDDIVDDSIESGFWKKFGATWREHDLLRNEVEKWPRLKKHLEEIHGRSPGLQARKKFGARWREHAESRNLVGPEHLEEELHGGPSRGRSQEPQPGPR